MLQTLLQFHLPFLNSVQYMLFEAELHVYIYILKIVYQFSDLSTSHPQVYICTMKCLVRLFRVDIFIIWPFVLPVCGHIIESNLTVCYVMYAKFNYVITNKNVIYLYKTMFHMTFSEILC